MRRRRRQQLLLALLDLGQVGADDALRIAVRRGAALVQPERLVAEALDQVERMRDQQDGLAAAAEFARTCRGTCA